MHHLSEGFLDRVMSGEPIQGQLIFQVLVVKRLNISTIRGDIDRYRLRISDGQSQNSFVMLATPLNHFVNSNILTENSIVQINKYAITRIQYNEQERTAMVIINMEVIIPGYKVENSLKSTDISFIEDKLQLIDISD